jgi:hypothetical protein
MNPRTFVLILAMAAFPALGLAQTAAPTQPPAGFTQSQMRQHMAIFRRFHEQMEREHAAARAAMLSALSAAHRELLAHLVGQMAISAHPDHRAAARELDAALSAHEKAAILQEQHAVMEQMHSLMEQMRTQMQSMTQGQHGMMHMHGMMEMHEHEHHTPDPGEILLRTITNEHPPMMQFMMVHHSQ